MIDDGPGTKLGLFYRGKDNSVTIYTCYNDGATWSGNTSISDQPGKINPETSAAPAACLYNNRLYLVYRGWIGGDIFLSFFDGATWEAIRRSAV